MNIFEANHACKKMNGKMLIKDVSIHIAKGEKMAITGKNGSGKSSLLKLIGGIYRETEGQVKRAQVKIGYVPELFPENIRFTVSEYLRLLGNMSSHTDPKWLKRMEDYTEGFAISEFLHTPLKKCSKGTKQKVGIIQVLLQNPDLFLLDEPLTGLDDKSKKELLNTLHSLDRDQTIIFTAHDPLLIEGLANRVLTIESGRIVSDVATTKKEKERTIKAKIPRKEMMGEIPSVRHKWVEEDIVEITVSARESDRVLIMLLERKCSVLELIEKR
ncbi:ATP-binding cassette domain-containing protein [Niallia sp. Krafla_26]|uniref:ATP-binding cassette domain-containing protein n=1 Tax=Niallia sp. Krafla_26 TaxID=3064703 RepID=UPI003D16CF69